MKTADLSQELQLPRTEICRYHPESDIGGKQVEFRLIYRGKLPAASKSDTKNWDKHAIRCQFHSQLRTLWRLHPTLRVWDTQPIPEYDNRTMSSKMADNYERCGHSFLPLISTEMGLACSLDILFLRRDNPGGFIISGGDIDNRLKVLFDAMRIPQHCEEIPPNWKPDEVGPLYCLLEDDKLISEIKVTTDRLIIPPEDGEHMHDVLLVIHVRSKVVDHTKAYIEFWQ